LEINFVNLQYINIESDSFRFGYRTSGGGYTTFAVVFSNGFFSDIQDLRMRDNYVYDNATVTVTKERAISTALSSVSNFSYVASDGRTVSGFSASAQNATADLLRAVKAEYQLHPCWTVVLNLSQTYPDNVSQLFVNLWADTGEVYAVGNLAETRYPANTTINSTPRPTSPSPSPSTPPSPFESSSPSPIPSQTSDVYVGIDLAYGLVKEHGFPDYEAMEKNVKSVIDQVSSYTNFFVLGASGLANNATRLKETLQYAYEKGLSFVSFSPGVFYHETSAEWYNYARNIWGNRLLGFYTNIPRGDEPGGRQLDNQAAFSAANNISDAATQFSTFLEPMLGENPIRRPHFTSDYGLYWFDYKAGYDAIFTEFILGSNNQLAVALCRGAAAALNKEWGVIITYGASFEETGNELYNDMILAYDNGAKYIVVFDSNPDHSAGSLKPEHFQAMQQFWQYIHQNPRKTVPTDKRVAYVLPKDYGVGLRWREEKIWGLFHADNVSTKLYDDANNLLEHYVAKLDIVYDDGIDFIHNGGYSRIIQWDSYNASSSPSPQEPTAKPTSSNPPTPQPTSPTQNQPVPPEALYTTTIVAVIIAVAAVALVLRKRRNTEKT
jgi:hypothetical protein